MIRRYFYIFSATLFILITPTTGVKAEVDEDRLEELARKTNSPPEGFNYQAVLRDNSGEVLANSSVTMRFTLSNSTGDVWVETHTLTTNAFGVISLVIGQGSQTGGSASSFSTIDWSTDVSVKVESDSGSGFVDLGTSALQSVPYAEYAANGLTPEQEAKLDATDLNAEENVQADWNETDNTSDAFVLNKPDIPSDINELTDADGLLNGSTFDGSFNSLTDVPVNLDTDATDDFSGSFSDLTNVPANLDTDATDDFSGSFTDLTNVPVNLDVDSTDDFSGSFTDLTNVPANLDTNAADDFSGSFNDLTNVPTNLDTDATDDFSGSYNDLSDLPANLDTDATDDFSGSYNDLTDVPVNLDTDATDDFSGSFVDLTNVPVNLDTDATDDFSGSYNDLSDLPANLDTDATDDFSGSFADLTNVPVNLDTDASDDFSGSFNDLVDVPADLADGDDVGAFSTASNIISAGDADDDLVFGLPDLSQRAAGPMMFFDKSKGAFRVGSVGGSEWDDAYVGFRSFAAGTGNQASGIASVVSGGYSSNATGQSSTVGGGDGNTASGRMSTIGGGVGNEVSGYYSTIPGGKFLSTSSFGATALGMYNSTVGGTTDSFVATDPLLVVGNGTNSGNQSDALVMLKNGNTDINGDLTVNALTIEGAFTLPTTDGSNAQFLATFGDGTTTWADPLIFTDNISNDAVTADKIADGVIPSFSGGGTSSFVGGGSNNINDSDYSSIVGGKDNKIDETAFGDGNRTTGNFIGGGYSNYINSSKYSVIGGGHDNHIDSSGGDYHYSTIAGGKSNETYAAYAFVGGGKNNLAVNSSAVAGGVDNKANASFVTIPGGKGLNSYSGYSTVIGKYNSAGSNGGAIQDNDFDPFFVIGNGSDDMNRSDLLVMDKAGRTLLNGQLTLKLPGSPGNGITLPGWDGTSGQVLTTDGNGLVTWGDRDGGPVVEKNPAFGGPVIVPNNTPLFIVSTTTGAGISNITMPTSSSAGDRIVLSLNTHDAVGSRTITFTGPTLTTILDDLANNVYCIINQANPTMELMYDGDTWMVINGNFTFP